MQIKGVLFDKDGTLFDFQKSWANWIGDTIAHYSAGDDALRGALAETIGYDLQSRLILAGSVAIAGTSDDVVDEIHGLLPQFDRSALIKELNDRAATLQQVEVLPLQAFVQQLSARPAKVGVATNDTEGAARSHLQQHGVESAFDFICGYDSGYGVKPGPGMCLAFAEACELVPASVAMVGDSLHDLEAGRAAGMKTVGVLTGVAGEQDLAPFADVVLPDIGHLHEWLH